MKFIVDKIWNFLVLVLWLVYLFREYILFSTLWLVLRFAILKGKKPGCLFSFKISKLDGWKYSTAFLFKQKNWVQNSETPRKFKMKFPFLIHSKISNFQSFRGFFASFYFTMRWPTQSYTYIPSTINTWSMFWHTKWDWVWCKMINHGLNHGLFSLPFKFFEWKCILNLQIVTYITKNLSMCKQVYEKTSPFLSAQMTILSGSFLVFIVLRIYNFVTIADLMETYTQSKEVGLV